MSGAGKLKPRHYAAMRWLGAFAISALIIVTNIVAWRIFNPTLAAPDVPPQVAGFAYSGFLRWDSPLAQRYPESHTIAADLRQLSSFTERLRTYSSTDFPDLPRLAEAAGLKLALGIWLDRRGDNNAREIAAALEAARQNRSVERLIAGNETQLHRKVEPAALYATLDHLRHATRLPVSTAEPWHVWLEQPELAEHVDFITVHLLPYWEGVPVDAALTEALRRYAEVRTRFPGKPVVIGEIGWPSEGAKIGMAEAAPALQAQFVRAFLAHARDAGLDYYLMEAIDQPWKRTTEGAAGPYWGILDARRQQKFTFSGAVENDPYWGFKAGLSSLIGVLAILPFLLRFRHMRLAGRVSFALIAQGTASFAVLLATQPLVHYLGTRDVVMLAVLVPALIVLAIILLTQSMEFAELFWPGSLRRKAALRRADAAAPPPFISIHLPCSNEPPDMVMATIDSLRQVEWPAFEIIVIDNNTRDPADWQPVAAYVERLHCQGAGPAVRFIHLPVWPGFKAGALNHALTQTDSRAAWIAVVDADYRVNPDWLASLSGYFSDPGVGIVQAPQAHREWQGHSLRRMMNWEYEGFFRIGMHHRHERDAIVQHGTMTLIRAAALREAGGWNEQCIVEDTELGLRLLQLGLHAVYVDHVQGTGLVPADFSAYRRQRRRWAQGAMQILRQHAGALFGRSDLSLGQRYHFIAGWLPWIGDALHLVFSLAAIFWSLGILIAPQHFSPPLLLFALPLTVFFLSRLIMGPLLYLRRVPCPAFDIIGAALAGMGLSHIIARGVIAGLMGKYLAFEITRRPQVVTEKASQPSLISVLREELGLLIALLASMLALTITRPEGDTAVLAWIWVLMMQALPYAATLECALISRRPRRQ